MRITECPRDAMQGLTTFIPTERKIEYINQLLKIGFDIIDVGSFVSPKVIPQMRDTTDVISQLEWKQSASKLLAIVANVRGAETASKVEAITYMGFPLSISETFQLRNTNKTIAEALNELEQIENIARQSGKKLVVYISMGFGNPYGDPYNADVVNQFVEILITLGADIISLADTVGVSSTEQIHDLFSVLSKQYPSVELGAHLHATPLTSFEKIDAAYKAGCRRFDGAIKGYGGCPMAKDELIGNIATETILQYLSSQNIELTIDQDQFNRALMMAESIFPK